MMTEADRAVAVELKERLISAAGERIRKIIIYGSRARGDAEPDSDLDVAVIVDRLSDELEEVLDEAAYEVMWDRDFSPVISLLVFEDERFEEAYREGYSFYRNVVHEGVVP